MNNYSWDKLNKKRHLLVNISTFRLHRHNSRFMSALWVQNLLNDKNPSDFEEKYEYPSDTALPHPFKKP